MTGAASIELHIGDIAIRTGARLSASSIRRSKAKRVSLHVEPGYTFPVFLSAFHRMSLK
jgi:hypothetical protein